MPVLFVLLSLLQESNFQELLQKLRSDDIAAREVAAQALLEAGESALAALKAAANSSDPEQAGRAGEVLKTITRALDYRRALKEGSGDDCRTVMESVRKEATERTAGTPPTAKSRRPDLLPVLKMALDHPDREVQTQAVWTLAYMNHERALPLLLDALGGKRHWVVRSVACTGLGWLARTQSLRAVVVKALKAVCDSGQDTDFSVRFDAAAALFELGDPPGAEIFVEAGRRRGGSTVAARALAHFDRKDAVLLVIKQMSSAPTPQHEVYAQVLERLTGQKLGNDVVKWYRWFDKNRDLFPEQLQ